jgi:acetyl esterase/lipase
MVRIARRTQRVKTVSFSFVALMSLVIPLSAHAVGDSPIDQSKPVATWCSATLFACNGYVPLSDEQYLPPWTPAYKNVQGYYHDDVDFFTRLAQAGVPTDFHIFPGAFHGSENLAPDSPLSKEIWETRIIALNRFIANNASDTEEN